MKIFNIQGGYYMEIFVNIIAPIISFLFAYLLCSISISVIVGKVFYKQDPREYGSKNPGGTNSGRLRGKKVGALVMFLDILKSGLAFWIVYIVLSFTSLKVILNEYVFTTALWCAPLGAVIGHCYSIFLKFKGGKGVSTMVGSLGSSSLLQICFGIPVFAGVLLKSKTVSISSIALSISGLVIGRITYFVYKFGNSDIGLRLLIPNGMLPINIIYPVVCTLICFIVIFRHRSNLIKIKNGCESKVSFLSK